MNFPSAHCFPATRSGLFPQCVPPQCVPPPSEVVFSRHRNPWSDWSRWQFGLVLLLVTVPTLSRADSRAEIIAERARLEANWDRDTDRDPALAPPVPGRLTIPYRHWGETLIHHRSRQAEEGNESAAADPARGTQLARGLVGLAKRAIEVDDPTLAYDLLHQAAYYDPDEPTAGGVTGIRKETREIQPRRGTSRDRQLGWDRNTYWKATSEHFEIVTNADEASCRALAIRLEDLHDAWRQLFFICWSDTRRLSAAIQQRRPLEPKGRVRHRVVLFASKEEYVRFLAPRQARIEITLGFYDVGSRTSYFFQGEDTNSATQFHEVTHQLFQELQPSSPEIGANKNFWMVEGIALYMESLRRRGDRLVVGGYHAERLQYARYRRLQENAHIPLTELAALGRGQLQQDERIRRIYSQAAGMTHFLMDGSQAKHRDGFIRMLRDVYAGNDQRNQLARQLQTSLEELDGEYARFLRLQDDDLRQAPLEPNVARALCLGKTAITDLGLGSISPQGELEWLDLSDLPISDEGLDFVRGGKTLKQVNLERTPITDKAIEVLVTHTELEELDLSHTAITDQGLDLIEKLSHLRTLWLTGTAISAKRLEEFQRVTAIENLHR